jgi:hypothetical protein
MTDQVALFRLQQQSKEFYAATGHVYQCWWRIRQEIIFFFRFEYHVFYVLYPFVTYLMTHHDYHYFDI